MADVWSTQERPGDGLSDTQRELLAKLRERPGEWLLYLNGAGVLWPLSDPAIVISGLRQRGLVEVYDERVELSRHNVWVRVPTPAPVGGAKP